jgi:hypothetical protein
MTGVWLLLVAVCAGQISELRFLWRFFLFRLAHAFQFLADAKWKRCRPRLATTVLHR